MNFEDMSKEQLIEYIINNENLTGKYGLVWDKEKIPEDIIVECNKKIPILKEKVNKSINNNKNDNNLLIEGDNFHSLSVLNYTHYESIDVIYIDPPYNTGSKDFIYNDHFVAEDDGYRHSKWLNFMQNRLKIAKKLLKDTGVIYISIDDNEYAQLKLLCDKIFGDYNYLGSIIQNKGNAQNDAVDIQKNHEYILVYRKTKRISGGKVLPTLVNIIRKEKDIYEDEKGFYYKNGGITTGGEGGTLNHRPNLGYTIYYNPETNDVIAVDDYDKELARTSNDEEMIYSSRIDLLDKGYQIIRPPKKGKLLGVWTWGIDKFNLEKDKILISKYRDGYSVVKKEYVDRSKVVEEAGKLKYYEDVNSNSKSIIDYSTSYGSTILSKMVEETKSFNNPKNHEMIKYLISLVPNKDAIVLDFFAGSGTTGQSVLELNKEDGGNRRFILCTNNENGICENVTYKRIKNTIEGNSYYVGIKCNLKYFETDFVENSNNRDQLYFDLTEKCVPMLCVKDGNFEKYKMTDEYVIYTNNDKTAFSCVYYSLFGDKEEEFISLLESIDAKKTVYKFALDDNLDLSIFKNVKNYSIEAIPYKIVELYKSIIKMTKED